MLTGWDIVCVSTSPWEAPYGSRQELMSRFAQRGRVLFIEPHVSWLHPWRYPQLRRRAGWVPGRLRQAGERLWVSTPPFGVPEVLASDRLIRWNAERLLQYVRLTMGHLGFRRPLLWIYPPAGALLLSGLDEAFSVYHCIDAFGQERPHAKEATRVAAYEQRLAQECDLVIAASQQLGERLRGWRADVLLMPPGVDRELFNRDRATPEPDALKGLRRPVIGYVGSMDERVDAGLLERLAVALPSATVLLVGPVHPRFAAARLRQLPNVRFAGAQPKAVVPAFLQRMDVCLIPYRVTPFTRAILPLKLFECLAMERPVVATMLPELRPYASVVRTAENSDRFLEAVAASLSDGAAAGIAASQHIPTWDEQADRIAEAIDARWAARARA